MAGVVDPVNPPGAMPFYEVSDGELGPGASLGGGRGWINTGTDGRIQSLFCTGVGEDLCAVGARVEARSHAAMEFAKTGA